MKSLKVSNLDIQNVEVLSKSQMQKILGGLAQPTPCAADTVVCYIQGTTTYYCFTIYDSSGGVSDCCCGADAGNSNCYAA